MAGQNDETLPQGETRLNYNLLKILSQGSQWNTLAVSQANGDVGDDSDEAKQKAKRSEEGFQLSLPPAAEMQKWAAIRKHPELLNASNMSGTVASLLGGENDFGTLHVMLQERPDLADAALKEAKRGAASSDPMARSRAQNVLKQVAENAADLRTEVFETAKVAINDSDSDVRRFAWDALKGSFYHRPDLAGVAFELVKPAAADARSRTRADAMGVLKEIVNERPDLATAAFSLAKTGAIDTDNDVRFIAQEAFGSIVKARPELGDAAMEFVKNGVADKKTRLAAMESLMDIVQVRPGFAETALTLAKSAMTDDDPSVRLEAQATLGTIAARRHDLIGAVVPLAEKASRNDPDKLVREVALKETLGTIQHIWSEGPTVGKSNPAPAVKQETRTVGRSALAPH